MLWNPFKPLGGSTPEELQKSRVVLWQGHCSVHTRFSVAQIEKARAAYPDINVVVHPECVMDVVQAADCDGSTEFIIKTINEAPSGSKWAVGTEISLVNRIALENPDKLVFCLDSVVCPCSTMISYASGLPPVVARAAGGRRGDQSDYCRRRDGALRPRCTGPDAE